MLRRLRYTRTMDARPVEASPGRTEPVRPPPYVAPDTGFAIGLSPLPLAAPLRWLRPGWHDFTRAPAIGMFYGAAFAAMAPWFAGLLVVAPVLGHASRHAYHAAVAGPG
jgi:uncharacterized membrane protein